MVFVNIVQVPLALILPRELLAEQIKNAMGAGIASIVLLRQVQSVLQKHPFKPESNLQLLLPAMMTMMFGIFMLKKERLVPGILKHVFLLKLVVLKPGILQKQLPGPINTMAGLLILMMFTVAPTIMNLLPLLPM